MAKLPRNVPIPDDPTNLSKDQVDAMLSVAHRRFIAPGTRVRIHSKSDRLNGLTGTVTTASGETAWVTLDPVDADDLHPEEIRFYDGELEKIGFDHEHFQEAQEPIDPDAPEPYAQALDYITPLKDLGYRFLGTVWRKSLNGELGYPWKGSLQIVVAPWGTAANVRVDYRNQGHREDIFSAALPAIEIMDMIREIEVMAKESDSVSNFTEKMQARAWEGSRIESPDRVRRLFGESVPDDPDEDTQRLFIKLQDDARIVNAFVDLTGLILRRKPSVERRAYEFTSGWRTPDDDIQYIVFLEPDAGGSWAVSAIGTKFFDREDGNRVWQDFEVQQAWNIPAGVDDDQLAAIVQDIWIELQRHRGPDEYEPDDIGESVDDINFDAYAKEAAGYNPVQLLTSKEIRAWVRELGLKVNNVYKSKRTTGWQVMTNPATREAFESFKAEPYNYHYAVESHIEKRLLERFPTYNRTQLNEKIWLHCWSWPGLTSAEPDNPKNWVVYIDIQPVDHQQRKLGLPPVKEAIDPDAPEPFINNLRAAKLGDVVNIKCPHCGHEKQIFKTWPDMDLSVLRLGSKCEQCDQFVPYNNLYVKESETLDDFDPERYAKTTYEPLAFLEAAGWTKDERRNIAAPGGGYKKLVPLPRNYSLGRMVFTQIKIIIRLAERYDEAAHISVYFVDDKEQGLPVGFGWTLTGQRRFVFGPDYDPTESGYDITMPLRKFAVGIAPLLSTIKWPTNPHATLIASSYVEDDVGKFVADLNKSSIEPLDPTIQESLDPDAPDQYVRSLGTIAHTAARFGLRQSLDVGHSVEYRRDMPFNYPMQIHFQGKDYIANGARVFLNSTTEAAPRVRLGVWLTLEGGGVYRFWDDEQNYKSEAAAALHLNEALPYLFQSLDDKIEGHRQNVLRDIIGMGVTPFMRRAPDEDEDPE